MRANHRWTMKDLKTLTELHPTHSIPQLMKIMGMTRNQICYALKKYGIRAAQRKKFRVSPKTRKKILALHIQGKRYPEIGKEVGMSRMSICSIVHYWKRKTCKHEDFGPKTRSWRYANAIL